MVTLFAGLSLLLSAVVYAKVDYISVPQGINCRLDYQGKTYVGMQAVADNGQPCKKWKDVSDNFTLPANTSADEVSNYCRYFENPQMPDRPWCFTESGPSYCDIPHCSENSTERFLPTRQCIKGNGFLSYAGNATHSSCLNWTDSLVQSKNWELWMFPGSDSWKEMFSHCRNPDNDYYAWCYTREEDNSDQLKKQYCKDIPPCSAQCRITEGSLEYVGNRQISESRRPCLPAQKSIPEILETYEEKKKWFEDRYVNDDYDVPLTSCRSYPEQMFAGVNELGPVCFVNNSGEIVEESCSIHFCGPGGDNSSFFFSTTPPVKKDVTEEIIVSTTMSAEIKEAWDYLENPKTGENVNDSDLAVGIGVGMIAFTLLFFFLLVALDCCSSIKKCKKRWRESGSAVQDQMKDLYGSRISLKSNQVSPCDVVSVDEASGYIKQ